MCGFVAVRSCRCAVLTRAVLTRALLTPRCYVGAILSRAVSSRAVLSVYQVKVIRWRVMLSALCASRPRQELANCPKRCHLKQRCGFGMKGQTEQCIKPAYMDSGRVDLSKVRIMCSGAICLSGYALSSHDTLIPEAFQKVGISFINQICLRDHTLRAVQAAVGCDPDVEISTARSKRIGFCCWVFTSTRISPVLSFVLASYVCQGFLQGIQK